MVSLVARASAGTRGYQSARIRPDRSYVCKPTRSEEKVAFAYAIKQFRKHVAIIRIYSALVDNRLMGPPLYTYIMATLYIRPREE